MRTRQCYGRKSNFERCNLGVRGYFCSCHRYQPVTGVVSMLTILAMLGGLYRDVIEGWFVDQKSPETTIVEQNCKGNGCTQIVQNSGVIYINSEIKEDKYTE